MKMMQNASNTGPQHSDELKYRINMEELLTTIYTTLDFDIPPGTPVADIVQAINLEFPGRDAEVVAQAAVLLHEKGTPPRSRAEEVDRFWDQAKAMGNPPRGSESIGRPAIETVLPESSHAPSEPTAPSHSAPSTSDTADPTSAAKKSLDALPSEEALALQRAMKEARAERADAKGAPSIFAQGPETAHQQGNRAIIPGMFQRPNGQYYYISSRTGKAVMLTSGDAWERITKYKADQNRLSLPNVPTGKQAAPAWRRIAAWRPKNPQPKDAVGIVLGRGGASVHCPEDPNVHGLHLRKLPEDPESRQYFTRNAILALLNNGSSYGIIIEQLQRSGRQKLAQSVQDIVSANKVSFDAAKITNPASRERLEHADGHKIHYWLAENIAALNAGQVFKLGTRQQVRAVILQKLQPMEYRLAA